MDQMWEIIGVAIAILMVIFGLRLLIKKPQEVHSTEPQNFAVDELSQQPITPRHLRETPVTSSHVDVCEIPNAIDDKDCDEDISQNLTEIKSDKLESRTQEDQPESIQAKAFTHADPNEYDALVAKLNKEEALVKEAQELEADQINLFSAEKEDVDQKQKIQDQPDDAEIIDPQLADKGKIDEWDGESDLLDAHLSQQDRTDEESALATAEHFVALYMYPNPSRALSGDRTLKMLLKYGLRFGEMSCFHRYEHPEHESPLMFSVLKITNDGAPIGFDLESMPSEEIKGLAFFLALPNPNAVQGFDMMASIAGLMARDTDGMVFDEQSLELTPQLRDHWRHFVIEYRPDKI